MRILRYEEGGRSLYRVASGLFSACPFVVGFADGEQEVLSRFELRIGFVAAVTKQVCAVRVGDVGENTH